MINRAQDANTLGPDMTPSTSEVWIVHGKNPTRDMESGLLTLGPEHAPMLPWRDQLYRQTEKE